MTDPRSLLQWAASLALAGGCGAGGESGSGPRPGGGIPPGAPGSGTGTATEPGGDDGGASGEDASGTAVSTGRGDSSAGPTGSTGSGGADDGTSGRGGTSNGTTGGGIKFDLGAPDGETGPGEDCRCGSVDTSFVFIANSVQGTISKIDTRTLEEQGRYFTMGESPSRTSVSIDGEAVVVTNRHGGIAKFWARPELCDPMANGIAGLQTSTDRNPLAAGTDDCLAWYVPFADMTTQRPVQWTPGVFDESSCSYVEQKVWTVTGRGGGAGTCSGDGVFIHRLDGRTGAVEDTVHIPDAEWPCSGPGAYGGAVDADGNFWFLSYANGRLVRVDYVTLGYEIFPGDGYGYGITVDTMGRVWSSRPYFRFDYATGERQTVQLSTDGGIAEDHQGRMWAAQGTNVVWIDRDDLTIGDTIELSDMGMTTKGVSVDVDGYIWVTRQDDPIAYRIHPNTYDIRVYDGLDGPYTYSDMTGGQLYNVTCTPDPPG